MIDRPILASAILGFAAFMAGAAPCAEQAGRDEPTPCGAAQPQPSQSALWPVTFCNRTQHDLVMEFRDNDCPVENWARRGVVYRRTIRRGESLVVPLCYGIETPETRSPAPGIPQLRMAGGKGVVTTWTVIGDCGERSDALHGDALSFYDRGDFKSGITLLQFPAGASHCIADAGNAAHAGTAAAASQAEAAASAARTSTPTSAASPARATTATSAAAPTTAAAGSATAGAATAAPLRSSAPPASASPPVEAPSLSAPSAPSAPPASGAAASASTGAAGGNAAPSLSASIDPQDTWNHTVHVYASGNPSSGNIKCTFMLALSFTDGGTWNDRTHATVPPGASRAEVLTRKYGKSVAKVELNSQKCAPL